MLVFISPSKLTETIINCVWERKKKIQLLATRHYHHHTYTYEKKPLQTNNGYDQHSMICLLNL